MAVIPNVSGSIYDCEPINQTGQTPIIDQVAKVLVTSFIVGNVTTGNQLIIDLAKGQLIPLGFSYSAMTEFTS